MIGTRALESIVPSMAAPRTYAVDRRAIGPRTRGSVKRMRRDVSALRLRGLIPPGHRNVYVARSFGPSVRIPLIVDVNEPEDIPDRLRELGVELEVQRI